MVQKCEGAGRFVVSVREISAPMLVVSLSSAFHTVRDLCSLIKMVLPKVIKITPLGHFLSCLHLFSPPQAYPMVCFPGIELTAMLKATHVFLFSPELFLVEHWGLTKFSMALNPCCMYK